jgi:hypothetical protein
VKVHASWAFFIVGGVLAFLGILLLLATPSAGVLILLLALVHVAVGQALRARERRRSART